MLGLLMSGLGASASLSPAHASDGDKKRIVVLGDSITAGFGLERHEAYPALLQKKVDESGLAFEVTNAGVSGDTTAGGLRRIDWALGQKGADVLVIALGGNDGLRGISPEQTEKNLTGIIEKARLKNPALKILIAGMQMPDNMGPKYVEAFKAVFPKVADAQKIELLPFLLEGVGGDEKLNQADQIHPTAEGQQKIADLVWVKLKGML
ncbi:acyl-CoA thioesterase-1 [Roseimicrobium gellanilyticum]|uniref:Acyl-CoA thioesterase-1 n=1 Tax=Roseimicrobium gellanilyticum TaxID=748857 RepID=A0A366HD15_9BACT|nr:arylesterase [Roseimicrobium gellanilyticum]RBP40352.1 acyl-CoA thioesterase-1 [Roseimicrobium gellanilyticum]